MVPWRSRWLGEMLVTTATCGLRREAVKLKAAQLEHDVVSPVDPGSRSSIGSPMFPPTTASVPASRSDVADETGGGGFSTAAGDADDRSRTDSKKRVVMLSTGIPRAPSAAR